MKTFQTIDRWKNRRRMTWWSLIAGLLFPLLILVTESQQLGAIAGPFYLFVGSVVSAYMGFAVWDDKNMRGANNDEYTRQPVEV